MFWLEVDPLSWIAFKEIEKKKKKGLKKFGPHLGSDASKFPSGQLITGTGMRLNLVKAWIYQNSLLKLVLFQFSVNIILSFVIMHTSKYN